MRRINVVIFIMILAIITSSYYFFHDKENLNLTETIANYPIDETKRFTSLKTTIQLLDQQDEDEYIIEWQTYSELIEEVYLSHDIALLFEDGRLKKTMSKMKENSTMIDQIIKIPGEDSGHYEAISFHFSQVRYPNDVTKSVQGMSYDHLYVLDSPLSPIKAFKKAHTAAEKEGQRILDTVTQQNLQYTWQELTDFFHIPIENYYPVSLTNLHQYGNTPLPTLTKEETKEIISTTWEEIYKNYFLGIKKDDSSIISPLGSSIPLILYHRSYSHILIMFISLEGEKFHLITQTERF